MYDYIRVQEQDIYITGILPPSKPPYAERLRHLELQGTLPSGPSWDSLASQLDLRCLKLSKLGEGVTHHSMLLLLFAIRHIEELEMDDACLHPTHGILDAILEPIHFPILRRLATRRPTPSFITHLFYHIDVDLYTAGSFCNTLSLGRHLVCGAWRLVVIAQVYRLTRPSDIGISM